ncbi:MAG: hypothetical protein ABIG34_04470 [Candidatus Peregrinibacteria bacterium]
MLSLYALVRFALSRSPLREQRELLFANTDPNDPQNDPEQREQGERNVPQEDRRSPIEEGTRQSHIEIQDLLHNLDAQQIMEEMKQHLEHPETFASLFDREETLEQANVYEVADRTGLLRTLEGEIPLHAKDAPQVLLEKILDYDRNKGLPTAVKRDFVRALIESNSQVTAALSYGLCHRLDTYTEQQRIIEASRPFLMQRAGPDGMALAAKIAMGTVTLREAVNAVSKKRPMTMDQIRELRMTLDNASEALRITEDFGVRFWGESGAKPEHDEERRKAYLRGLKEETQKLAKLLSLQVRQGVDETVSRLEEHAGRIRSQVHGVPEDSFFKRERELVERLKKVNAALDSKRTLPLPENLDDPEFPGQLREYIRQRERAVSTLSSIQHDADVLMQKRESEGTQEETQELKEREQWANRCLHLIDGVLTDPDLSEETRSTVLQFQNLLRMKNGRLNPEVVAAFGEEEMTREEYVLRTLLERGEVTFVNAQREGSRIAETVSGELDKAGVAAWAAERKREIKQLKTSLTASLTHPICKEFEIVSQLQEYAQYIERQLTLLGNEKIPEAQRRDMATRTGTQIEHWRTALELVRTLERQTSGEIPPEGNEIVVFLSDQEYLKKFHLKTSRACYREGKIWIRRTPDLSSADIARLVHHEKAHALFDILSEQSHLLPELLESSFGELTTENWALLEQQGERWGVPTREEVRAEYRRLNPAMPEELLQARADAHYRRLLLNEAAVSGALAAAGQEDRKIFESLRSQSPHMVTPEFTLHVTEDQPPMIDNDTMAEAPPDSTSYSAHEDLEEIDSMVNSIRTFGEAVGSKKAAGINYLPQVAAQVAQIIGTGSDGGLKDILAQLQTIYQDGKTRDGNRIDPATNPVYRETVTNFKSHVAKIHKQIQDIDHKISDISDVPQSKKGTISQKLGVQWLCILDIMRIYKEIAEDVVGIWTSIQDRKTAETKAGLTKNLPSKIPGTNTLIPILGKYTERLHHYNERRKNQLELDRVKKWEDSFKNLDAEELLNLIDSTPTLDQLKASIGLLVEKGRMDWNDERVWKALNEKSKYQMPFGPCKRSEVLRDKWLHKLISDIWRDKDKFNEWVTSNSSNYDKHKKEYSHEADNFSNIAGQAAHELATILQKYEECTKARPRKPFPEEVNPHHYEELLHYAMRNGKMSMEQKTYYLVRGIASGLMPLERLRALAGESGELLMKFPFLDYFYQRHNSLSDIRKIAQRITEVDSSSGKPTFLPGIKTTMFLRLVLLRDAKARERMSKAMDRVAEGLDHEDAPYFATEIDWLKMRNLLGVVSGDRKKVTVEGCKNSYMGFNEKFKMYAYLARMAQETGAPIFRTTDIEDITQSITAYLYFDNQMMRATEVTRGMPSLTENQLNEGTVSNPAVRTSDYRTRTRDFIGELIQGLGMQDFKVRVDDKTEISMSDFIASERRDREGTSSEKQKIICPGVGSFAITEQFMKAISQKIRSNPGVLRNLLISMSSKDFGTGGFLDSGTKEGADGALNLESFTQRYHSITGAENGRQTSLATAP